MQRRAGLSRREGTYPAEPAHSHAGFRAAHPVRRAARQRCRGRPRRQGRDDLSAPRGGAVGGRFPVAAAPDAVGDRACRGHQAPRHRCASRPCGRRAQPARPSRLHAHVQGEEPASLRLHAARACDAAARDPPLPARGQRPDDDELRGIRRLPAHRSRAVAARHPAAFRDGSCRRSRPQEAFRHGLQHAHLRAAAKEPRHGRTQRREPSQSAADRSELPRRSGGHGDDAQGREACPPHHGQRAVQGHSPAGDLHERRLRRRRLERIDPRAFGYHLSSRGNLPDGGARRCRRGRRSQPEGARARRALRRRCLGDADADRWQYECAHDHDRRESGRSHLGPLITPPTGDGNGSRHGHALPGHRAPVRGHACREPYLAAVDESRADDTAAQAAGRHRRHAGRVRVRHLRRLRHPGARGNAAGGGRPVAHADRAHGQETR